MGEINSNVKHLLKVTKQALLEGIDNAVVGKRIGDIGFAIQNLCENSGYGVVREFVGHGIGRNMHEDPQVPNYGRKGYGPLLKTGMCIAIEPMITWRYCDKAIAENLESITHVGIIVVIKLTTRGCSRSCVRSGILVHLLGTRPVVILTILGDSYIVVVTLLGILQCLKHCLS